jgi:long-chain acyl-CoA synthetase
MSDRPWLQHYDEGVPADLEIEETLVSEWLSRAAREFPDRTAVVFKSVRLSYRQLDQEVDCLATAFERMGVGPGVRIAVHLPNVPQAVIGYLAALRAGGEVVLTNPMYTGPEIEHQWHDAGCEVAVTADFLFDRILKERRESLPIREYVIASIPEYLPAPIRWLAPFKLKKLNPPLWAKIDAEDHVHRFRELVKRTPARPHPTLDFNGTAVLQYTGGTTGLSKGAVLTHKNLSVNVQQVDAWLSQSESGTEVMLACLPLFHSFGMTVSMNWAVSRAMTIVLVPDPRDENALFDAVEQEGVTVFPGVPAIYNALNHHPRTETVNFSTVRACICGSAPISVEVMRKFEDMTGSVIVEGFGLSETSPVATCNPVFGDRRPGWIGIPVSSTRAKVVDADDTTRELPPGEEGELLLAGPQVMQGYWNRPEETAQVLLEGGWLATGDLAIMSEDGFFRVVGRKKDMINCSGFKVYPDEVDAVLIEHEAVLEAATIGVPHEERGETVRSYVVLNEGAAATIDDLQAWCRERLAPYKVPREVEFIEELPKSTVMKVLRRELRDRAMETAE